MGIWGSVFGWKTLFRWDVLGVIVPGIFLAAGVGILGVDWFPHSLLIAQLSFTTAFALFLVKIIGHAIESEGSVPSRVGFASFFSLISLVPWFLIVHSIQLHKANPNKLSSLTIFLGQPWVRHILWMLLGMVVLMLCNSIVFLVSMIRNRAKQTQPFEKGFLDYKLQAETAIEDIGPAITPISSITSQVGNFMEKHARDVSASVGRSTKEHWRVTRMGSVKLDRYSRRL